MEFHSGTSGGHLGVKKTLERLKHNFYWVGCHQAVKEWITNCSQCIAEKGRIRGGQGHQQQYSSGAPLKNIAMANGRTKARYDRAANMEGFHKGQLVLLYNPQQKKGLFPKLQTSWDGPYKIIKRCHVQDTES